MFENLKEEASNFEKEMKAKFASIVISEENGGVSIKANGNGMITEIDIDETILQSTSKSELEDLLLVLFNKIQERCAKEKAKKSAEFLKNMLPGMGNLFK